MGPGDEDDEDDEEEEGGGGGASALSMPEALERSGNDDDDEEYDDDDEDEDDDIGGDRPGAGLEIGNTECSGDVLLSDAGQGLPFRPGSFDGVVSVSAIQWLCYSNATDQDPKLRLNRFFSSLYSVLKKDAKAVLQFYPETPEQAFLIAQAASRVGFAGGLVVDYPNSAKAKKYYLVLSFERTFKVPTSAGVDQGNSVDVVARARNKGKRALKTGAKAKFKSRDWVLQKKEKAVKQGKQVKTDSKYSGRKRSGGF
jgi:18S rRNA (guanine1575-N7)-methyltransferase